MNMDEILDKFKTGVTKVKDEATKLTKQVVDKTSNIISKNKLLFAVSESETRIKDIYAAMGKNQYDDYLINGTDDENVLENCKKIDALIDEIADLKEKISQLGDAKLCKCGEYNKKDAVYCSKCGNIIEDVMDKQPNFEEEVVIIKPKMSDEE